MKPEYRAWIKSYVDSANGHTLGKCGAATASMVEAFPELRAIRGHVETSHGRRSHWWCVTAEGAIVDPTVSQFMAVFEYEEFNEGDPERLGKCMNCGYEIWAPRNRGICNCICSRKCADDFQEATGGPPLPEEDPNTYVQDTEWRSGDDDE